MKTKLLIILILGLLVLTGCKSYDEDCLDNYGEDYCKSIDKDYYSQINIIGKEFFYCLDDERYSSRHMILKTELEDCRK